jgi:hypothetical protein
LQILFSRHLTTEVLLSKCCRPGEEEKLPQILHSTQAKFEKLAEQLPLLKELKIN